MKYAEEKFLNLRIMLNVFIKAENYHLFYYQLISSNFIIPYIQIILKYAQYIDTIRNFKIQIFWDKGYIFHKWLRPKIHIFLYWSSEIHIDNTCLLQKTRISLKLGVLTCLIFRGLNKGFSLFVYTNTCLCLTQCIGQLCRHKGHLWCKLRKCASHATKARIIKR